jgi:hypothetical protein
MMSRMLEGFLLGITVISIMLVFSTGSYTLFILAQAILGK